MDRRELLKYMTCMAIMPTGLIIPKQSEAAIPAVLATLARLLVGSFLRGGVTRAVTHQVSRKMVTASSLGLKASGLFAVSSSVALAYEKHNASAIWVAGQSASQNVEILTEPNKSSKREMVYMGYRVIDLETKKVEKVGLQNISTEPDKRISLDFVVKNLPHTGAKLVEGIAYSDPVNKKRNPNFYFTESKVVIVADRNSVATEVS